MLQLTCAMCGQPNVSHKRDGSPCEGHCIGRRHGEAVRLHQAAMTALTAKNDADFDRATRELATLRGKDVGEVRLQLRESANAASPNRRHQWSGTTVLLGLRVETCVATGCTARRRRVQPRGTFVYSTPATLWATRTLPCPALAGAITTHPGGPR